MTSRQLQSNVSKCVGPRVIKSKGHNVQITCEVINPACHHKAENVSFSSISCHRDQKNKIGAMTSVDQDFAGARQ